MKAVLAAWDRFWFSRFDPLSVSVFRICLGLLLLAFYLANGPNWERFYAADGALSLDVLDPSKARQSWWSLFYWTEGLLPVRAWWWVGLAAAAGFTVGWWTRLCTVLLFAIQTSMSHTNWTAISGEDIVFRLLLFGSCFAPLSWTLSLDSWLRQRRGRAPAHPDGPLIWPVRLLEINVALIYALSVANKLADDIAWQDGTAIYWAVLDSSWSRWPWPELFAGPAGEILSAVATYGTLLIEGAFPLLVWFRRTRLWIILPLAALHLGIAVFLQNLVFFSLAMICSFWLFLPAETTRRLFRL